MNTFDSHPLHLLSFVAVLVLLTAGACGDNTQQPTSDTGALDSSNRDVAGSDSGNSDGDDMNSGSPDANTSDAANPNNADTGLPVELASAANYVILAKSGISNVPTSTVTGDIAVSPIDSTAITGFSLSQDPTTQFSTSSQVTGSVYASDYSAPTPSVLTTAVSAMETAFTTAAGRPASVTELGAGDIGGMTLDAGVYAWGTGLLVPTDVTLAGSDTDVWIFQIAQDLTLGSGTRVVLSGGAKAENIFWQVGGQVTIETTSHLEGVVLSQTAIVLRTGATVNGRLLAQTAVELDGNTVVEPAN